MRRRNASSARRVVERRLFSEYIEKLLRGCFLAVALAARLFLLYAKGDFLSISVENNNKNKNHSKKLAECGTPFCYSALGCIIVCSDKMYCECGGMKNKLAGEDFYFIQEMIKNVISKNPKKILNPIEVLQTTVMPATRFSDRVLFGTGKALEEIVEGNFSKAKLFKDEEYLEIKNFINLFNDVNKKNFPLELQREAEKKCRRLYYFLYEDGFFDDWKSIVANNQKSSEKLEIAFHCKFDGLKIIRALHYLQTVIL
jgi:hypothetical protein